MSTAAGGGPDDGLDVERAWADIVSRWDEPPAATDEAGRHDPAEPTSSGPDPDREGSSSPAADETAPAGEDATTIPDRPPEPAAAQPPAEPQAPAPDPDEDEAFVPEDPPGWSALVSGWAAVVAALIAGPPVVLLVLGMAGHDFTQRQLVVAGVCFVVGMLLLIWRLQGRDNPPPPDDGAVV